jgi:hypothetical protein
MVAGFWVNQDGLPLQFGTQKPIPELGGDYLVYGETREIEQYICLGATSFGNNALQVPALPSSFSGTSTPIAAGIQSMTNLVPLQVTAPVTVASSGGVLTVANPQIQWDMVEVETLIAANAGSGGATGITVGLVTMNPATQAFVQVTPNAGTQIIKSLLNAQMTAGNRLTWYPDATVFGTAIGSSVAGDWMGTTTKGTQIPLVTNSITPLPNNAWISAIAAGGTYTGSSGGGLLKLRLRYTVYGTIVQ